MNRSLRHAAAVAAAVLLAPAARAAEPAPAKPAAERKADAVADIRVGGMTCGGCVDTVTGKLKAVPGVRTVVVNLEKRRARVTYDASRVTTKALADAIKDAGFEPGVPSVH
jgi:copper chaperone